MSPPFPQSDHQANVSTHARLLATLVHVIHWFQRPLQGTARPALALSRALYTITGPQGPFLPLEKASSFAMSKDQPPGHG